MRTNRLPIIALLFALASTCGCGVSSGAGNGANGQNGANGANGTNGANGQNEVSSSGPSSGNRVFKVSGLGNPRGYGHVDTNDDHVQWHGNHVSINGKSVQPSADGTYSSTGVTIDFGDRVNGGRISGNGRQSTISRAVTGFNAISVSGSINIVSKPGPAGATVTADSNIIPVISTTVENGILEIKPTEDYNTSNPVTVTISAPSIASVESSGSSAITMSNLDPQKTSFDLSGSESVTCTGSTTALDVKTSGSSSVEASQVKAQNVDVDISGSSNVNVYATGHADIQISGSGNVNVSGRPSLSQDISGSGHVNEL